MCVIDSYFSNLNGINVSDKIEKKNGLSYLSWSWAWGELKKRYPNANYTIYENQDGWNYFTDGRTCWVKTSVTVEGIEHIEHLAVMDYRNKSIPLDSVTSMDITKSIQRCLTKAIARHGLGLYIYAGEDLPEEEMQAVTSKPKQSEANQSKPKQNETAPKTDKPTTVPKVERMSIDRALETKINGIPVRQIYKENRGQIKQIYEASTPEQREALEVVQAFVEESQKRVQRQ